jgi:hypothetical protein
MPALLGPAVDWGPVSLRVCFSTASFEYPHSMVAGEVQDEG